jgi:hypothetical protein
MAGIIRFQILNSNLSLPWKKNLRPQRKNKSYWSSKSKSLEIKRKETKPTGKLGKKEVLLEKTVAKMSMNKKITPNSNIATSF